VVLTFVVESLSFFWPSTHRLFGTATKYLDPGGVGLKLLQHALPLRLADTWRQASINMLNVNAPSSLTPLSCQ
jgi:hypothetical protein